MKLRLVDYWGEVDITFSCTEDPANPIDPELLLSGPAISLTNAVQVNYERDLRYKGEFAPGAVRASRNSGVRLAAPHE